MMGRQMTLQRLEFLPVLQADHEIGRDRLADGYCGNEFFFRLLGNGTGCNAGNSCMDIGDEPRQFARRHGVIADIGGDDVCGQLDQIGFQLDAPINLAISRGL